MSLHIVLLEKRLPSGRSRRCDYRCYNGQPDHKCRCICGGQFHGVGLDAARALTWEHLDQVRQDIELAPGEHVQMRVGA